METGMIQNPTNLKYNYDAFEHLGHIPGHIVQCTNAENNPATLHQTLPANHPIIRKHLREERKKKMV